MPSAGFAGGSGGWSAVGDTAKMMNLDTEAGTWVPSIVGGGAFTLSYAAGRYSRIGKFMYINFVLKIDLTKSTGAASQLVIGGLPIIASSMASLQNGLTVNYMDRMAWDSGWQRSAFVAPGTNQIVLRGFNSGDNTISNRIIEVWGNSITAITPAAGLNEWEMSAGGIYQLP
jgi:hypothetical protein